MIRDLWVADPACAAPVGVFESALRLAAAGHDRPGLDSAEHWEFVALAKKLEWELIQLPPHAASLFDPDSDGPPPAYLKPSHAMYIDWPLSSQWRRPLQDALEAQRKFRGYCWPWSGGSGTF